MKSEAAIRHKLQQVLFRHLKQLIEANFQKLPQTCGFNGQPKTIRVPRMCLFGANLPATWQGRVCDENVDGGVEQARDCPYWKALRTKEAIKAEFKTLVSKNRAAVAARYPDAAALLWVLEEDAASGDFDLAEEEGEEEDSNEPQQIMPPAKVESA